MSRHDPLVRVQDMRDHAQEAIDLLAKQGQDQLRRDRVGQLALMRLIEVIGEAASWVDPSFRSQYPSLPWRDAISMRNRLIHGYHTVRVEALLTTVIEDLPPLVDELNRILDENDTPAD